MNQISTSRTQELLADAPGARILVVGDLMLDRYLTGSVDRISPEAPVPVVRVERESWALGGAGNVVANIVALGAKCDVVGSVGADPEGARLLRRLSGLGAGVVGVAELGERPTTVKTRIMARHQHVTRVDREDASDLPGDVAADLAQEIESLAQTASAVVLEDYNKGILIPEIIKATLQAARDASIPVIVDPKKLRFFEFPGATVFKPNYRELEDALGERIRPDEAAWMEGVRDRLGCETLLLTLGDQGMALQSRRAGYLRVPTSAREVYDVSGAGDTVTAVMAVALSVGATHLEAAILANHAAAVEVGKAGVATVSPADILRHQRAFIEQGTS